MAKANLFRLSTKYQDDEPILVYYGYRYYAADDSIHFTFHLARYLL